MPLHNATAQQLAHGPVLPTCVTMTQLADILPEATSHGVSGASCNARHTVEHSNDIADTMHVSLYQHSTSSTANTLHIVIASAQLQQYAMR